MSRMPTGAREAAVPTDCARAHAAGPESAGRGAIALAPNYETSCAADERGWDDTLALFEDANIYQTWRYGAVISGPRNIGHVVMRRDGEIVGAAQARITRWPLAPGGIAYVRWGPLWRRDGRPANLADFRQIVRALRNEFVCRRGMILRLYPRAFGTQDPELPQILKEEGFAAADAPEAGGRTILMDLTPSLDQLRLGMRAHWNRELKIAERKGLIICEGSSLTLFDEFIAMYKQMVARKKFVEPNDIYQFRSIQEQLPERLKMIVMLCRSGETSCAGLIASAIGDTAVYLFGATSNSGIKSGGSYLLHWALLDRLKRRGVTTYNLNGINPAHNPGTYKFKNDLAGVNGRDVFYLGRYDAHRHPIAYSGLRTAELARAAYRNVWTRLKAAGRVPSGAKEIAR